MLSTIGAQQQGFGTKLVQVIPVVPLPMQVDSCSPSSFTLREWVRALRVAVTLHKPRVSLPRARRIAVAERRMLDTRGLEPPKVCVVRKANPGASDAAGGTVANVLRTRPGQLSRTHSHPAIVLRATTGSFGRRVAPRSQRWPEACVGAARKALWMTPGSQANLSETHVKSERHGGIDGVRQLSAVDLIFRHAITIQRPVHSRTSVTESPQRSFDACTLGDTLCQSVHPCSGLRFSHAGSSELWDQERSRPNGAYGQLARTSLAAVSDFCSR
jgi:hypothetical protein